MAFTTLQNTEASDYVDQYTTGDSDVQDTAVQTGAIALRNKTKVSVQAQVVKSGGTSTDQITVTLQGSHDGTIWFDYPDVAGTGQEGTAVTTGLADTTEVERLNYDFSQGSGQSKPLYIRVSAVSGATNGTKAVNLNILATRT